MTSVPNRQDPDEHRMVYPRFTHLHVDNERLIIKMVNPIPNKRDCEFQRNRHRHFQRLACNSLYLFLQKVTVMAPSRKIFDVVLEKLTQYMKWHTSVRPDTVIASERDFPYLDQSETDFNYDDADPHVDLIEFPSDGSSVEILLWIILSPLRVIMHYTLPDVRQLNRNGDLTTGIRTAFFSTFMCLLWLIIGSYAMVASLEDLAELLDVPDSVIGFTVSAAGKGSQASQEPPPIQILIFMHTVCT